MWKIEKLVQCLQELQVADYNNPDKARVTNAAAERALNAVFYIATRNLPFTVEQKKTVGHLLSTAIRPIQGHIERTGCVYRTRLDSGTLRKRSALQFLIDNYGNFPAKSGTLNQVFERENIKESIRILDDIIRKWRGESDSEVDSDRETGWVPDYHTWWF